jgi:hypothetical protein
LPDLVLSKCPELSLIYHFQQQEARKKKCTETGLEAWRQIDYNHPPALLSTGWAKAGACGQPRRVLPEIQ